MYFSEQACSVLHVCATKVTTRPTLGLKFQCRVQICYIIIIVCLKRGENAIGVLNGHCRIIQALYKGMCYRFTPFS